MAEPFRFKQFAVAHNLCAMKVNTDGVLLGAWQHKGNAKHILDIGTGTGVIALMMAQGNAAAQIDAIDIDESAFKQATANFAASPWAHRLCAVHSSMQEYLPARKYDIIISNPPYFINDYQSDKHQKNIARHGVTLSYTELLLGIARLLTDSGKALIIIPAGNFSVFRAIAFEYGLFITACIEVIAVSGKSAHVIMLQLERVEGQLFKSNIIIQNTDASFTDAYRELTKDFYLAF